jgi:hypothetical protein
MVNRQIIDDEILRSEMNQTNAQRMEAGACFFSFLSLFSLFSLCSLSVLSLFDGNSRSDTGFIVIHRLTFYPWPIPGLIVYAWSIRYRLCIDGWVLAVCRGNERAVGME